MAAKWHFWLIPTCLLAALSAGCVSPPTFSVETVVHSDGSCDRTIRQPKDEFLPAEALEPDWNARWRSVDETRDPAAPPNSKASAGERTYFTARGSFRSPREIPPHYRFANAEVPEVGASELERTYERLDYGFVVEHRWSEKITDIVTLPGFLKARDKLLDIMLPFAIQFIEKEFGPSFDLSGLSTFIRTDVRRGLEEASVLLYDAGVRRRIMRDDETMDPELAARLVALSRRIGFDPLDARGKLISGQESERRSEEFVRRVVIQHVRHRNGSNLERPEVDALIARARNDPNFMKPDKRQEERLKRFVMPLVFRMAGLYGVPLGIRFSGSPRYDFTLRLPGELIESNGTIFKNGRTRWNFTADRIFPEGFEMRARSLEIDREGQKKVLGRVAIDDEEKALEFLEVVGDDGSLMQAVRKLKETGDRGALVDEKDRTFAQNQRAERLREILFGR